MIILEKRVRPWSFLIGLAFPLLAFSIRNYIWTGNPLAPLLGDIFNNSLLGPSWIRGRTYFENNLNIWSFKYLLFRLKQIIAYYPTNLFFFSPVIYIFLKKQMDVRLKKYWLLVVICLVVFSLIAPGSMSETRHLGIAAISIPIISLYMIYQICSDYKLSKRFQLFICLLVILIQFVQIFRVDHSLSMFPPNWTNIYRKSFNYYLENFEVERVKSYLDENSKTIVFDDTPLYYFFPKNVVKAWDDPSIDKKLEQITSFDESLKILEKMGFTHLYYRNFHFDPYYNKQLVVDFQRWIKLNNKSIIYLDGSEVLVHIVSEK